VRPPLIAREGRSQGASIFVLEDGYAIRRRLFLYYNERTIEGTAKSDVGAAIRTGIKSVAHQGDCPESVWPYIVKKFKVKPPEKCYANALKYRAVEYQRLRRDLDQFKGCLASVSFRLRISGLPNIRRS